MVFVAVDCGCVWECRRNEVSENWDNRRNRNRRGGSCQIGDCSSDDGVDYDYNYNYCYVGFGGFGGFGDDSVWEVVMMWWMMKKMKRWMRRRRQRRVTVGSRVRTVQRTRWIGPPVGRIHNRPLCVVLLCFLVFSCLFVHVRGGTYFFMGNGQNLKTRNQMTRPQASMLYNLFVSGM